jgi:hypothetical protein
VKANQCDHGRAERDGAATGKAGLRADALRLAAPSQAMSPTETGMLGAIREQLASTGGASVSMRDVMVEFHGETEGSRLYDEALKNRDCSVKLKELRENFEATRAEIAADMQEGRRLESVYQDMVNETAQSLALAETFLNNQHILNQQLRSELRALTEQYQAESRSFRRPVTSADTGGQTLVALKQWAVPDWYRPESETLAEVANRHNGT